MTPGNLLSFKEETEMVVVQRARASYVLLQFPHFAESRVRSQLKFLEKEISKLFTLSIK